MMSGLRVSELPLPLQPMSVYRHLIVASSVFLFLPQLLPVAMVLPAVLLSHSALLFIF